MYTLQRVDVIGDSATPIALTTAYTGNTKTLDVEGIDSITLNLKFTAAAANSIIQWKYEYSHDGVNFFGEDITITDTAKSTHSPAAAYHQWTPGSAAAHNKTVTINPIDCKKIKLSFQYNTAGGTLWAEALKKETYSR